MLYFEDFPIGRRFDFPDRTMTAEEIIAFATEFDPQPMHLDENAAKHTILGGLAASGWHTCSIMMRLLCDGLILNSTSQGSPGIDEVKWRLPVRPGDTLTVRHTILEKRESKSRPGVGLVKQLCDVVNQRGESVMQARFTAMFGKRNA